MNQVFVEQPTVKNLSSLSEAVLLGHSVLH